MSFDPAQKQRVARYLARFDLKNLFLDELGWDRPAANIRLDPLTLDELTYTFTPICQKREFYLYEGRASDGQIPPSAVRSKLETWLSKRSREHMIVFVDDAQSQQVWQWARREPGQPTRRFSHSYHKGQQGESLLQKLEQLEVAFAEEEDVTLVDVSGRVRAAFSVERATKKFYDQFKKERNAFEKFVEGIPDVEMSKWYVSVMLNRLMFVYFIQRKGFLDGDTDYLRHRLQQVQALRGSDEFHSFYRYFLLRLFHEGLGQPHHDAELERLIGKVPYLNGGIFQLHEVEQTYPNIQISDEAFTRIFDFFDQYQWHLDDRPLRDDREINPDVLGYIFEKYINQKQMGAYYTKEDITEYISKNTIIPFLFDAAQKECAIAFSGEQSIWRLPQADPDRYIYPAVQHGADLPLPEEIAAGLDDVSQRGSWNTPTADGYGLPTEIWRETVARRQRYAEVKNKLAAGEVTSINDFITYNLDIRQLAQDVIETSEGPELLRAFWQAVNRVTVLDPTCGSGAFLFAALNILQPLYEGCLARMQAFVEELGPDDHPHKYRDFKQVLAQMAQHPNPTYFVLKSIVVNNLYGVDIMPEAVEIARLRLFLKLVALVERVNQIEPLPDIDFNIRAGNTLVGFASKEEVRKALQDKQVGGGVQQSRMLFGEDETALRAIEEKAGDIDRLFSRFRAMQIGGEQNEFDAADFATTKKQLHERLKGLEKELNELLARQYGVHQYNHQAYQKWESSHQPFHWFTEFYGILEQGGFDVIIGNPPYVQYKKVEKESYSVVGFRTISSNNLFALVMEQTCSLLVKGGRHGMIVPMSIISTQLASGIKDLLVEKSDLLFISNYSGDAHPGVLFTGVKMRLSIILGRIATQTKHEAMIFSTKFIRWFTEARDYVFEDISYVEVEYPLFFNGLIPKVGLFEELSILKKIFHQPKQLGAYESNYFTNSIYSHRIVAHFVKSFDFVPYFWNEKDGLKKSEDYKVFQFKTSNEALIANAILNSNTFYYFYILYSDAYHCGRELILGFPFALLNISPTHEKSLIRLNQVLMGDMQNNSVRRKIKYRTGWIEYDEFYPRLSKSIIDQIDQCLAEHYDFSPQELDFIVNYDIKYRMGNELFDEETDDQGDD